MKSKARRLVEAEFFAGHQARLVWNTNQSVFDGVLYLGALAGPQRSIVNLCHEMSHFVEIDDRRCCRSGWALKLPEIEVCGQLCIEPVTHQSVDREIRVAAFQHNLLMHIGVPRTPETLVRSFSFLPAWCYVPKLVKRKTDTYDTPRFRWCAAECRKLIVLHEYSVEAFRVEWWRKNAVLKRRYTRWQQSQRNSRATSQRVLTKEERYLSSLIQ